MGMDLKNLVIVFFISVMGFIAMSSFFLDFSSSFISINDPTFINDVATLNKSIENATAFSNEFTTAVHLEKGFNDESNRGDFSVTLSGLFKLPSTLSKAITDFVSRINLTLGIPSWFSKLLISLLLMVIAVVVVYAIRGLFA